MGSLEVLWDGAGYGFWASQVPKPGGAFSSVPEKITVSYLEIKSKYFLFVEYFGFVIAQIGPF